MNKANFVSLQTLENGRLEIPFPVYDLFYSHPGRIALPCVLERFGWHAEITLSFIEPILARRKKKVRHPWPIVGGAQTKIF